MMMNWIRNGKRKVGAKKCPKIPGWLIQKDGCGMEDHQNRPGFGDQKISLRYC